MNVTDLGPINVAGLPLFYRVKRSLQGRPPIDPAAAIDADWDRLGLDAILAERAKALGRPPVVALGVGSRGITELPRMVRRIVDRLKSAGAEPFLAPAMGSHTVSAYRPAVTQMGCVRELSGS